MSDSESDRAGINIALPPPLADRLRRAVYALQGNPLYRFKHQAHDRLLELGMPLVEAGAMPDIYAGQGPTVGKAGRSTIYPLKVVAARLDELFQRMQARGLPWSEFTILTFRAIVVESGCGVVLSGSNPPGGSDAGGLERKKRSRKAA